MLIVRLARGKLELPMTTEEPFERIEHVTAAFEAREQDRRLGERIDALVSAIGTFLAKQNPTWRVL
jgi:hypothetical protein